MKKIIKKQVIVLKEVFENKGRMTYKEVAESSGLTWKQVESASRDLVRRRLFIKPKRGVVEINKAVIPRIIDVIARG